MLRTRFNLAALHGAEAVAAAWCRKMSLAKCSLLSLLEGPSGCDPGFFLSGSGPDDR